MWDSARASLKDLKMRSVFTTSFGDEIEIIPNYRSQFPGVMKEAYDPETAPSEEGLLGIVSDIYQFSMAVTWIDFILGKQKFKRLLDIGGNTGTITRLLKATGRAESVTCLDNIDFSRSVTEADIRGFLKQIAENKALVLAGLKGNVADSDLVSAGLGWVPSMRLFSRMYPFNLDAISQLWTIDPEANLGLDGYIPGDVYKLTERYDFITMFSSLDWFAVDKMFKKAFELLEPGGVFFVWCGYWWSPTPMTSIYGDFPFAVQRLIRADVERYFNEFYPQDTRGVLAAYDYFHKGEPGLTVADYQRLAAVAGFEPLNYHRLIWTRDRPKQLELSKSQLQEVLRDIGHFKQNITVTDLMTNSNFMLFQKPGAALPLGTAPNPSPSAPLAAPSRWRKFSAQLRRPSGRT